MKNIPSPNFNARREGAAIRSIILHYTGMPDAQSALKRLCDPQSEVSAHLMIDEAGEIYRLVADTHRAWHAGQSFWQGETDLNSVSIGIELVNKGHEFGYTPFPAAQIEALKTQIAFLMKTHTLPASCLWGHSDIAPLRKEDPGELFPWQELAAEGMGVWPIDLLHPPSCHSGETFFSTADERKFNPESHLVSKELDKKEVAALLAQVGYDCRTPEVLAASQIAFLRHFHAERLEAGFNEETIARLRALARLVTSP